MRVCHLSLHAVILVLILTGTDKQAEGVNTEATQLLANIANASSLSINGSKKPMTNSKDDEESKGSNRSSRTKNRQEKKANKIRNAQKVDTQQEKQVTTKSLTASELKKRAILYKSMMAVGGALLVALATSAHIYKTGKCEVLPVIRCQPELSVEFHDVWSSIKSCCARFKACFSWGFTCVCLKRSNYEQLRTNDSQSSSVVPTEVQQVSVEASAQPQSKDEEKSTVSKAKVEVSDLESAKHHDKRIQYAKQRRRIILGFVFIGYIALCILVPFMDSNHTSCNNGFFWEDHIPFGVGFFVSKMVELLFYVFDPSLDGQLPLWKFMLAFFPSFLGFVDAYQDYTSTIIAHQCSEDLDFSNHQLAGILASSMTWSFWLGVFALQWMFLGAFAMSRDFSGALIAKLLHMDSLALCITVPEGDLWMMRAVNMIRTVGEDVPQAVQQTLFVVYVKENFFMIISIIFSVMCSCKAAYDAIKRPGIAAGHEELMEKYRAERLEKIKEAKAQGSSAEQLIEDGYLWEELLEVGFPGLEKEKEKEEAPVKIADFIRMRNVQGNQPYLQLDGERLHVSEQVSGEDVWVIESTTKRRGDFVKFGDDVQLRTSEDFEGRNTFYLDVNGWAERPNKVYRVSTSESGDRDSGSGTWKILPVDVDNLQENVCFDTPLYLTNCGYSSKEAVLDYSAEDGLMTADSRIPTSGAWMWELYNRHPS